MVFAKSSLTDVLSNYDISWWQLMNAATKQALCLSFFYALTEAAGIASERHFKFYFQLNVP